MIYTFELPPFVFLMRSVLVEVARTQPVTMEAFMDGARVYSHTAVSHGNETFRTHH